MKTNPMQTASRTMILLLFARTVGRVIYGWGAKAGDLWRDSSKIFKLDCSGFVQWVLFRASQGGIIMPEGSVEQHEWCQAQGWKACAYADVVENTDEGRFFVCYLNPKHGEAGHTWLVSAGHTYESSGHHGVNSRSPKLSFLMECDACFEVPTSN